MSSSSLRLPSMLLLSLLICSLMAVLEGKGNFFGDVETSFGDGRVKILDGGQLLTLTLDNYSGCGFKSKKEYIFARFDVEMKLIPENSAGTVTTFYLTSAEGPKHDEVDFEFLGNTSGDPYTVHTNVFAQGQGKREQGFHLWFDPTKDFHKYSIVWNPERIMFLVDGKPIRVHENLEKFGVPFPTRQPMKLHATLWNGDQWATKGGSVKIDWSKAPFIASYRNLNITTYAGEKIGVDAAERRHLQLVQRKYMIYNYCNHFPNDLECRKGFAIMRRNAAPAQKGAPNSTKRGVPNNTKTAVVPVPGGIANKTKLRKAPSSTSTNH